jgi:hypothetical protein
MLLWSWGGQLLYVLGLGRQHEATSQQSAVSSQQSAVSRAVSSIQIAFTRKQQLPESHMMPVS